MDAPVQPAEPHALGSDGAPSKRTRGLAAAIAGGTVLLVVAVVLLSVRERQRSVRSALIASPRPVTVVVARGALYRDFRTYVGAVQPWVEANVGPQFISAYVDTVLVRPGANVTRGQVLATLDCTNPTAATRAVAMQARAADARVRAAADEASRVASLLDGGYIAPNEVEQKSAISTAEQAQLLETRADLLKASLDVRDCVLKAPFDGEVATRTADPGAFVRPGESIVSVVDRSTVRVTVDAPESDFDALAPGTVVQIEVLATGARLAAPISRVAPKADPKTRTIHFEVDVPDSARRYPVGTTARVRVDVGAATPATDVPIYAATQASNTAKLFVVDDGTAHARTLPVLGETGGQLFFSPQALAPGADVVIEGRELLSDGDRVAARVDSEPPARVEADGGASRGGGYGRSL